MYGVGCRVCCAVSSDLQPQASVKACFPFFVLRNLHWGEPELRPLRNGKLQLIRAKWEEFYLWETRALKTHCLCFCFLFFYNTVFFSESQVFSPLMVSFGKVCVKCWRAFEGGQAEYLPRLGDAGREEVVRLEKLSELKISLFFIFFFTFVMMFELLFYCHRVSACIYS